MGIFDFFKGNNSKLRVNANECEDVGIVTHYKGKPLTGICFRFYENTDVLEMEIEMNEGLKNGKWRSYDNEGKLKSISICKNDKIISRKYLDKDGAEIIVPNWFDGELYENGDSIKFNNNSFRFSALELSIYDLLMGAYDIIMSLDSKSHPQYASLDLHIKNCLDWFKEANPRFYKEIIAANGNLKGAQMAHLFESNETEKSFKPQAPELIENKEEKEEEENREIYNWDYEFDDSTNEWKKYDESYNGLNEIYYDDATNDGLKTTFNNKNGKKEGLQKIYYEKYDDSNSQELRCELNWKDGKKEGKYKYYFRGDSECESKVMEEGFFKNDEQSGIWKHFYEYGGYEEGKYRGNYKKIGVWKYYNEYDELDEERDFGE